MYLPSKEELDGILSFNFLFTNSVQTERQTLTKWINPNLTKNYRQAINQYISDEEWDRDRITRDTNRVVEEWDRDPVLLEEDNPF